MAIKKVTTEDFSQFNGHRLRLQLLLDQGLSNSNIWLSGVIGSVLGLVQKLKNRLFPKVGDEIPELSVALEKAIKGAAYKTLKDKLIDIVDISSGRTREQIRIDINQKLSELSAAFSQPFQDCVESLPGDSLSPGGDFAVGLKVDSATLRFCQLTAQEIAKDFAEYRNFNQADAANQIKDAIKDFPGFLSEQIEALIVNKLIEKRGSDEAVIQAALQTCNTLIGRLDPNVYPDCKEKKPTPPKRKTPKPPPQPTSGDCCDNLVLAINNIDVGGFDYGLEKQELN
jgi:hypothetical protein